MPSEMDFLHKFVLLLYIILQIHCLGHAAENNYSCPGVEILFLGQSGSGKSSTINMLLGKVVTNTRNNGKELTQTKNIFEYTLSECETENCFENSNDSELSSHHCSVKFIDTPGLGSTKGKVYDARVLATLQKYLQQKDTPPIILIFSKFDDNRVEGEHSNFVKILKKYNQLESSYKKPKMGYPQIIFVFSHYLSVSKKYQRNPTSKISLLVDIIQNSTTFPPPIITSLADNEAEDEELELDKETSSYVLPNGELYPQNLIDKIMDALAIKGSTASEVEIYERIFRNRLTLKIHKKSCPIPSNEELSRADFQNTPYCPVSKKPTKHSQQPFVTTSENSFHVSVTDTTENSRQKETDVSGSTLSPTEPSSSTENNSYVTLPATKFNSEILEKLNKCEESAHLNEAKVESLKAKLYEKNLTQISQLPREGDSVIRLIQNISLDNFEIDIFTTCVPMVEIPKLVLEDPIVGYGYDILQNIPLANTPFKIVDLEHSSLGFKIPNWIEHSNINPAIQTIIENTFDTNLEFLDARLRNLSLENSQFYISANRYHPKFTAGNNILETISEEDFAKLTTVEEHRLFNWRLKENTEFNSDFIEIISELPLFEVSKRRSILQWKSLFENYGTHIVCFAFGGGSLETHLFLKQTEVEDFISHNYFPDSTRNFSSPREIRQQDRLKFNGGLYKHSYVKLNEGGSIHKIYKDWKQSLSINPIILETNLKLIPLSEIIKEKYLSKSLEMEKATIFYLSGNVESVQVTERPSIEFETTLASNKALLGENTRLSKRTTTPPPTSQKITYNGIFFNATTPKNEDEEFESRTTERINPISTAAPKTESEYLQNSNDGMNVVEELSPNWFQFYLEIINRVVTTLRNTCHIHLQALEKINDNDDIAYSYLLSNVNFLLNGIINAINSSGAFCRNKSYFEKQMSNLNHTVNDPRLAKEELIRIYNSIRYFFMHSQGALECTKRVMTNYTSEFMGSHIGYGYNIQYGLQISKTPFDHLNRYIECDRDFYSPDLSYTYTVIREGDVSSYYQQELSNVSPGEPYYYKYINFFYGPWPPGVNGVGFPFSKQSWLQEYTMFSAKLSSNPPFSLEFKSIVNCLPKYPNLPVPSQTFLNSFVMPWKHLFTTYGTHIVVRSNAGGSLEITPDEITYNSTLAGIAHFPETRKSQILGSINIDSLTEYCPFGGNTTNFGHGLRKEALASWINSLRNRTVLLQSNLQLVSIVKYVRAIRPDLASAADYAMGYMYAGHMRSFCGLSPRPNGYNCGITGTAPNLPRESEEFLRRTGLCHYPRYYKCSMRHACTKLCDF